MVITLVAGSIASSNSGLPLHGGDVAWAAAAFPSAPRPFVDLSTGINPWSYPDDQALNWRHLPRRTDMETLLSAARVFYGVPSGREVIAVAGVELAIRLLPHILPANDKVQIVGPTYSSYIDAWSGNGSRTITIPDAETLENDGSIAVVVSPNNPDGRVVDADRLRWLAERLSRTGGWLVVDRSFADVSDEPLALTGTDNLIELRSFGKFFGLPGLRLGFAIAGAEVADKLRAILGAWPLNTAALAIGERALLDTKWHKETRSRLARAAHALDHRLNDHLEIIGGTHLFRLARTTAAAELFMHLGMQGILTRIFDYRADWIRIGLPPDEAAGARLDSALSQFSRRLP